MENTSSDCGGAKPGIRFGFSWADEVEREEREQQQQEEEERRRREMEREQTKADPFGASRPREVDRRRSETEREQQIKADPFGAARPREVVLAEKGVDWRARDRELDLHLRIAPRPRCSSKHAAASKGAVAAHGATPARGEPRDRDVAGAGRTPHPRGRRAAASTPLPPLPPTVSHSAWGGSKRKCAGEGPGLSRRVVQVDEQRRKVFGELNVGEGCVSSIQASNKNKSCDSGRSQADGIKSSVPAAADGENRCSSVPATKVTATEVDGFAVAQKKRRGGKRRNGRGSKKTANQQTLVS